MLHAGDVHGAALAPADPALAAEQLGQDRVGRGAAGQRVRVTPVGAERVVVRAEHGRGPHRDRFLAEAQVHRAVDQALPVQRVGPLLEMPQETHLCEEFQVIRDAHGLDATVAPRTGPRPGRPN